VVIGMSTTVLGGGKATRVVDSDRVIGYNKLDLGLRSIRDAPHTFGPDSAVHLLKPLYGEQDGVGVVEACQLGQLREPLRGSQLLDRQVDHQVLKRITIDAGMLEGREVLDGRTALAINATK